MSNSKIIDLFCHGNAVHGERDYGLADTIVRIYDELINAAYRRIRILSHKDMKSIRFVIILLLLCTTFEIYAKKKQDYPRAELKVGYIYNETFVRGSDGIIRREIPFILLANKETSKFYNSRTEFLDSLQSTPQGRAIHHQLLNDAVKRYSETKDENAMSSVVHKTFLYIFRSRNDNRMTVYDKAGMLECGYYTEPLDEIQWEISDSTKTVLGYDCVMAKANYHRRKCIR